MLTEAEQRALKMTADLWNLLVTEVIGEGVTRGEDCRELMNLVHGIQRMIGAQAAARIHPDLFRLLGEVIPDDSPAD